MAAEEMSSFEQEYSIVNHVSNMMHIPAIRMEWNESLSPDSNFAMYEKFIVGLVSIINLFEFYDWENSNQVASLHLSQKNTFHLPHNRAEMSAEMMRELDIENNDYITVMNCIDGSMEKCVVKVIYDASRDEIRLHKTIRESLALKGNEGAALLVQKYKTISVNPTISTQSVSKIVDNIVAVSKDIYDRIDKDCVMYEFVNNVTRTSLDVMRDKVVLNNELKENTIQLNYMQRQMLELEIPSSLEQHYVDKFMQIPGLTEDQKATLYDTYNDNNVIEDLNFKQRRKFKDILNRVDYYSVSLYPVNEYVKEGKNLKIFINKVWETILSYLIGTHTVQLKCIRPYASDESSNVVRLTTTMLKMIGVENTDNVIIKYRSKKVRARVLEVDADSFENMQKTNTLSDSTELEHCIGVPAHLRSALGMKYIDSVCEVYRDTNYLFKKHANLQLIPTIAIFFTVYQIFQNVYLKVIITFIALVLSLYVNFSTERNKISS